MKKLFSLLLVGIFALSLAACDPSTNDGGNGYDSDSSFRLLISDQPADIADFEYLNIPILSTRIFSETDGEESFVEEDINVTVNLTELVGTVSVEVLELDLEPGNYTKIELYVDQPNIDAATVDETEADIFVPSGKLMIENDFEVVEGEQVTFVFDINIVKTGPGTDYNLTPVISESGVVGEDLEDDDVDEIEVDLESQHTTEELPVYAQSATIPDDVTKYITEESLTDDEEDEVVVMAYVEDEDEWVEKTFDLGEPEDVTNDNLEVREAYTWITLAEDNTTGTLHRIIWVETDNETMNNMDSSFRLLVSDQPADIDDFEYLDIPIMSTRIFSETDGEEESYVEKDINVTVDLTQLVGSASVEVLELDLEPGNYTKIELYVDQPNIDAATVDETEANIFVPSGKLMIENDFEVVEGEQVSFVFDINIVKTGPGTDYNLIPVISESGVVGEDLDESEVDEVDVELESEIISEELTVYAADDTIPEEVTKYITAESLTDDEEDEVIVMEYVDEEWVEKTVMLGEPEDVTNDDLEEKETYTWVILSEDESTGTLYKVNWVEVEETE